MLIQERGEWEYDTGVCVCVSGGITLPGVDEVAVPGVTGALVADCG